MVGQTVLDVTSIAIRATVGQRNRKFSIFRDTVYMSIESPPFAKLKFCCCC